MPADVEARNRVLLAVMGSPDVRQIDGIGGAHPLTSKVAVVSLSDSNESDIDYLFPSSHGGRRHCERRTKLR